VNARISQIVFVVMAVLLSSAAYSQRKFESHKSGDIWRHWYVKATLNMNAMFGDVSTYDHDPFNKIAYETKFGFTAGLGKWVTPWGGAEFNFSMGAMKSIRGDLESQNNFLQYTLIGRINLTQLIYPADEQSPFFAYAKLGYGLIDFNSRLIDTRTGDTLRMQGSKTDFNKRVTEWIIPMGIGGAYNLDANFALMFELNYFYVHTDKLDGKYTSSEELFNDNRDSYANISLGLIYTFNIKETYGKYHRSRSKRGLKFVR